LPFSPAQCTLPLFTHGTLISNSLLAGPNRSVQYDTMNLLPVPSASDFQFYTPTTVKTRPDKRQEKNWNKSNAQEI